MTIQTKLMQHPHTVTYVAVNADYFENRSLRRYAGIWSLWALVLLSLAIFRAGTLALPWAAGAAF